MVGEGNPALGDEKTDKMIAADLAAHYLRYCRENLRKEAVWVSSVAFRIWGISSLVDLQNNGNGTQIKRQITLTAVCLGRTPYNSARCLGRRWGWFVINDYDINNLRGNLRFCSIWFLWTFF